MKAIHRKLLRDLRRMLGQVVTIAAVVAAGVAAYVSMVGNHASLVSARDTYYERSRFGDVFAHLERAPEAVAAELEAIPGVARVCTRVKAPARLQMPGMTRPAIGEIISVPPGDQPALASLHLTAGRLVEPGRDDEVVILDAFAEAHQLEPGDTVAAVLDGTRRTLRVVGTGLSPEYVMALSPGSLTQDPKAFAVLWMARSPLSAAFRLEGAFNDVTLDLRPGASVDAALGAVDRLLEPYGGLGAIPRSRQPSEFMIDGELVQLKGMATIVPGIFLAVAALLLNVVLSRLIFLQRSQIATLEAMGYSSREVGLHFFQFVSVIALLGAAGGLGLGVWMGRGLTTLYGDYFKFPDLVFELDPGTAATAVLISLGSATAGAFFSVRQVLLLPPAEAMRPPAPARYRRSIADRLGLSRVLGPAANMVLRELERRPLRTVGSSLAIASSVGLLVIAGWYRDGVAVLIRTQFHEVMREDVLVSLAEPVPTSTLGTFRQLPGVLDAQGLRTVPVRFRSAHHRRDGSIQAYPDDTDLRSPRDRFGYPVPLPEDGIVLTDVLGEILEIEVGDLVTVEVREGDRSALRLPVRGFIDESFGLQGHMRAPALEAALHQPPLMSSVLLRVDPLEVASLERALVEIPAVAGVVRRQAVLRQFEEQSGMMLQVMTVIITLFGVTITVGVVYNNARIALSLRSRDLASLRVLGYRRREVSMILLGEMAVQVLLALPIGLWFGHLLIELSASAMDAETYRIPIVVTEASHGYAIAVALVASGISALLVRRKLDRLDLIGVLKTRE